MRAIDALLTFFYLLLPPLLARGKDSFLDYVLWISVVFQGLLTGLIQVFWPVLASRFLQWPLSPFMTELGFANMAFALLAIISFWKTREWKKAAFTGYAIFLFLTGINHLFDIVRNGFLPSNWGFFRTSSKILGLNTRARPRPRSRRVTASGNV